MKPYLCMYSTDKLLNGCHHLTELRSQSTAGFGFQGLRAGGLLDTVQMSRL